RLILWVPGPPSMGPRLAPPAAKDHGGRRPPNHATPSMGPRLARRGIAHRLGWPCRSRAYLQWVHGSLAVVSASPPAATSWPWWRLQWVHGSLAVVSWAEVFGNEGPTGPSMGPRLARRGIVR